VKKNIIGVKGLFCAQKASFMNLAHFMQIVWRILKWIRCQFFKLVFFNMGI